MTSKDPNPFEEFNKLKEGVDYFVGRNGLNVDIKERDPRYKHIIKTVEGEVGKYVDETFGVSMGACHIAWPRMKEVLKERYDIDWHTPLELNPDVLFD